MSEEYICLACQKPWDEVHPLDWVNDLLLCGEGLHEQWEVDSYPIGWRPCRRNHTWREHVAESWGGRWINPHIKVLRAAHPSSRDTEGEKK